MGASLLGRGFGRHLVTDPPGTSRRASQRDHVPRGPARPRAVYGTRSPRLGHRRPQQPHQHLLCRRPTGICACGPAGIDRARTIPTPASYSFFRLISNRGTTSILMPSASSKPSSRAQKWPSWIPRLSNTAAVADYWLPTWPGSEAAVLLGHGPHPSRRKPLRREISSGAGPTGKPI